MDDHLRCVFLVLEAGGRWEEGTDCLLKLLSKLEEEVRGGGGDSNEL